MADLMEMLTSSLKQTQSNQRPTITPQELIDELIYASYVHNRSRSPHISPLAWAKVLPNVPAMERRFKQECEL